MIRKSKILSLVLGLITCILALLMLHLQSVTKSSITTTVHTKEVLTIRNSVKIFILDGSPRVLYQLSNLTLYPKK